MPKVVWGLLTIPAVTALLLACSGEVKQDESKLGAPPVPTGSTPSIVAGPTPVASPTPVGSTTVPGATVPGATVPGACTVQTGMPACDTCLQQACCTQISACDADPDCSAADTCGANCITQYQTNPAASQQCDQQCLAQHPTGGQKLSALFQCMGQACPQQCGQY